MDKSKENLYWTLLNVDSQPMHIAATDKGLCYVGTPGQAFSDMALWAAKRFPDCTWVENDPTLAQYADELTEYLNGKRTYFTFPLDLRGSAFQLSVWSALVSVGFGATRSYSELAQAMGMAASVRAVASAIGANPVLIAIPCHRIIGKNGTLTGYRGGLDMKTRLLQLEQSSGGRYLNV